MAGHRFIQNTNVQISHDERPSCQKYELFASRCKCESRAHFIIKDVTRQGFVLEDGFTFPMGNSGLCRDIRERGAWI